MIEEITPIHWIGFIAVILFFLALDLGVFHRTARTVVFKEALMWTCVWFSMSMMFSGLVYWLLGKESCVEYITGYIIELSLSMDNVFVIAVIFNYFKVPPQYQHRVLFWGILGALVMRGVMIGLGAALVHRFEWILYILGAFLLVTGIRMLFQKDDGVEPDKNPIIRLTRKAFPISLEYDEEKFVTIVNGKRVLTPLVLVLVMVETTDLIFAVDSIPAIFGITTDAFIIFTSNVFAILGLRSLYFVLAGAIRYFQYLKYGLSIVLSFIGVKMMLKMIHVEIPITIALAIVLAIILSSIAASVYVTRRQMRS